MRRLYSFEVSDFHLEVNDLHRWAAHLDRVQECLNLVAVAFNPDYDPQPNYIGRIKGNAFSEEDVDSFVAFIRKHADERIQKAEINKKDVATTVHIAYFQGIIATSQQAIDQAEEFRRQFHIIKKATENEKPV